MVDTDHTFAWAFMCLFLQSKKWKETERFDWTLDFILSVLFFIVAASQDLVFQSNVDQVVEGFCCRNINISHIQQTYQFYYLQQRRL